MTLITISRKIIYIHFPYELMEIPIWITTGKDNSLNPILPCSKGHNPLIGPRRVVPCHGPQTPGPTLLVHRMSRACQCVGQSRSDWAWVAQCILHLYPWLYYGYRLFKWRSHQSGSREDSPSPLHDCDAFMWNQTVWKRCSPSWKWHLLVKMGIAQILT